MERSGGIKYLTDLVYTRFTSSLFRIWHLLSPVVGLNVEVHALHLILRVFREIGQGVNVVIYFECHLPRKSKLKRNYITILILDFLKKLYSLLCRFVLF